MIDEVLYKKGKNEVVRRCVIPIEVPLILNDYHDNICGGNFASIVTTQKALEVGYW